MFAQEKRNNMTPVGTNGFKQLQVAISSYNPLKMEEMKITESTKKRLRTTFTSIGMVTPFQPSMWDDKVVDAVWGKTMKNLAQKMKETYTNEVVNVLMDRLKKLYARLNFNTHRKSLAIILTPVEERIIYLSFPVKPVIFFAKSISALELAANIQQEANFFYLVLDKNKSELYDLGGSGQLRKVYGENDNPDFSTLSQNVINAIELLNRETRKSVFVTGSPNLVELFCNSHAEARAFYPLLHDFTPFNKEIIQSVVREITTNWNYWRSKSIRRKILIAQQANRVISNVTSVLQALIKGMDGILLLDKRLKKQLQKPVLGNVIFEIAADLNTQIERFLIRGNQIEITETGLLRGLGGIALLPNLKKSPTDKIRHKTNPGEIF